MEQADSFHFLHLERRTEPCEEHCSHMSINSCRLFLFMPLQSELTEVRQHCQETVFYECKVIRSTPKEGDQSVTTTRNNNELRSRSRGWTCVIRLVWKCNVKTKKIRVHFQRARKLKRRRRRVLVSLLKFCLKCHTVCTVRMPTHARNVVLPFHACHIMIYVLLGFLTLCLERSVHSLPFLPQNVTSPNML